MFIRRTVGDDVHVSPHTLPPTPRSGSPIPGDNEGPIQNSIGLARTRFRIRLGDSSKVIPVFREKWSEGDRQFHWQVFERDRNGNLVAMGDDGPFTANLLATESAPPHTGGNSGAA
ncbi:hypothetical protein F5878DRAFT_661760 [Lentinula raphanica]|uniref:Uncharacterized protein n=1 Tax=Lentinula raphanica TaxID=153919 RepID=A0AA38P7M5_9AGAR|nr:hypothetical protein F5878DRAFT_661760 [Lentinula raphanica]